MPPVTIFKETITIGDSNTSYSDGPFTLAFNLAFGSSFSHFLVSPISNTPHLLRRDFPTPILTCVPVDLHEFDYVYDILNQDIDHWGLPWEARIKFINAVMKKTLETTRSMHIRNNMVLKINARVDVSYVTLTEATVPDDVMEESSHAMIPTTESAIESLEKKKCTTTDDCSVCLDEMLDGCDVTLMPCSHIFHSGCIEKWLRMSRYCPICRFEMPIDF